ncbi:hypothetical protein KC315_g1781 [Hortaea werneckii]|nr:hypothetical protein KC315_g1781 [Hortaea werneckii]
MKGKLSALVRTNMTLKIAHISTSSSKGMDLAPGQHLSERAPTTWRDFKKGAVVILASAYMVGDTLWSKAVKTCKETYNGGEVETGVQCVFRCIETLFKFALWYRHLQSGNYEAILNYVTGEAKRDISGNVDWHGHWHSLDAHQKGLIRNQLPPTPGFWMHSIDNGTPGLPNSATFHFAADGFENASFRHVTNGTHGFLHPVIAAPSTNTSEKRAVLTFPDDSFKFGPGVSGIKLSYTHPCGDYDEVDEDDLEEMVHNMVQSYLQGGVDKYAIEMDHKDTPIMLGTLIVEGSGFGSDYEGIDFVPDNSCHDEL